MSMESNGQSFKVRRTPEWESAGYPFLFDVTVRDGDRELVLHRLTKGDLIEMRRQLGRACREAVHDALAAD